MLEKEVFEEYGRKRLKDLLEKGERPVIVAGFIDVFGDAALTSCSICHVPIWVRPWIFEAMVEYDLKAVCMCCADPFALKGQAMMDFAKIEEGGKMKFVCESCGHIFDSRSDVVKERQCSKCRGRLVFNKEEARDRILELKRRISNLLNILEIPIVRVFCELRHPRISWFFTSSLWLYVSYILAVYPSKKTVAVVLVLFVATAILIGREERRI